LLADPLLPRRFLCKHARVLLTLVPRDEVETRPYGTQSGLITAVSTLILVDLTGQHGDRNIIVANQDAVQG